MFITYGKNFLATIFLYLICNNILFAQLSGPMTIDPSLPASATNFTSITAAVLALQSQGISAAVQFSIASGTYTEQITIGAITGASATHTITFQSATSQAADVIWQFSAVSVSSNFVLKLDDADHLIFSAITFRAQGSSYARAVQLINGANENTFESCRLEGQVPTWTSNDAFAVLYVNQFGGNSPSNNSFRQNTFQSGSWGAYFRDQSGSTKITGTLLEDNLFLNQVWTGVYFFQTNGNQILSNRFESADITYGMFISGVNAVDWQINRNLFLLSNPGATVTGMRLSTGSTTSQVEVHNNVIHLNNQTGTGSTFGIRIENCKNLQIYYNTIKVEGASTNAASSAAIYDFSTLINPGGPIHYINNIFANHNGGYVCYFNNDPTANLGTLNRNMYYTSGSNLVYWNGTALANLAAFQSNTSQDNQSVERDPQLVSIDDVLLVDGAVLTDTDFEAMALTGVTEDYFEFSRSAISPRKGASERGTLDPPFPVEWSFFTAKKIEAGIRLSWGTLAEENLAYFTVERSTDGHFWKGLKQLAGRGDKKYGQTYEWTDLAPPTGNILYRISQTDIDGSQSFTSVREVSWQAQTIQLYPNPLTDYCTVQSSVPVESAELFNALGQRIRQIRIANLTQFQLHKEGLRRGTYFLRLHQTDGHATGMVRLVVN